MTIISLDTIKFQHLESRKIKVAAIVYLSEHLRTEKTDDTYQEIHNLHALSDRLEVMERLEFLFLKMIGEKLTSLPKIRSMARLMILIFF